MDNPFQFLVDQQENEASPSRFLLATVMGVYQDGLGLLIDGDTTETQKHYKKLTSYKSPAIGDRVVVMKMSGTYVVFDSIGGPVVPDTPDPEAANTVYAGPASGEEAVPTFRSLVPADLPIVPISKGGTGQDGLYITETVSEILTAETGFSVSSATFVQFGKIAQLSAALRADSAVTSSTWTTWATIVEGKRPVKRVVGNFTRTSYCNVFATGEIQVSSTVTADSAYRFSAIYLLP